MEELISKYLKNDLNREETLTLKSWLEKDPLNRKVFENMVGEWNLSEEIIAASRNRVLERIMAQEVPTPTYQLPARSNWSSLMKIAAVLVLGIGLGLIYMFSQTGSIQKPVVADNVIIEKESQFGQRLTFQLPDGSIVKLNAGSKLTFPKAFAANKRTVTLTGEAFFEVERDEKKPFIINSGGVDVQVLGTSFNVKSYENESVEVAVKTGKVSVAERVGDEKVVLTPMQGASYDLNTQELTKLENINENLAFGWMDQSLVFEEALFDDIIKALERWFDVEFEVKKELDKAKKFTGTYKKPTLKSVMESLAFAYDFKYEMKERKIIIK